MIRLLDGKVIKKEIKNTEVKKMTLRKVRTFAEENNFKIIEDQEEKLSFKVGNTLITIFKEYASYEISVGDRYYRSIYTQTEMISIISVYGDVFGF